MEKNTSNWLTIGQAAKHLGVSRDTLRRWEKKGKLKAVRSPTNRRYYTKRQLEEIMNSGGTSVPGAKTSTSRLGFTLPLPFFFSPLVLGIIGFLAAVLLAYIFLTF